MIYNINTVANAMYKLDTVYDFDIYLLRYKAEYGLEYISHLTEQYLKDNLFLYEVIYLERLEPQMNILRVNIGSLLRSTSLYSYPSIIENRSRYLI